MIGNYGLAPFTQKFDIPFYHISHQDKDREVFENQILRVLHEYAPDYVILVKFMRILIVLGLLPGILSFTGFVLWHNKLRKRSKAA